MSSGPSHPERAQGSVRLVARLRLVSSRDSFFSAAFRLVLSTSVFLSIVAYRLVTALKFDFISSSTEDRRRGSLRAHPSSI